MSQVPHSKKSPRISPEDQKAIQTYWVVYEAHMVEIQDELAHLAEFPEYARFVQSTTPEQLIERQRTSRENQHKAIFEGDLGP
ncbi:MAG: hypothetical protein VB089_18080, partial [Anaerolineaceae bacterium]|nr:hypothetical protein [Anaerolineaceae bacterium]